MHHMRLRQLGAQHGGARHGCEHLRQRGAHGVQDTGVNKLVPSNQFITFSATTRRRMWIDILTPCWPKLDPNSLQERKKTNRTNIKMAGMSKERQLVTLSSRWGSNMWHFWMPNAIGVSFYFRYIQFLLQLLAPALSSL